MAEFLDAIFSSQGCQVDGTTGMNPVNQIMDNIMDSLNYASGGYADGNFMVGAPHEQSFQSGAYYGDDIFDDQNTNVQFSNTNSTNASMHQMGASQQLHAMHSPAMIHPMMPMSMPMMPMIMPMMPMMMPNMHQSRLAYQQGHMDSNVEIEKEMQHDYYDNKMEYHDDYQLSNEQEMEEIMQQFQDEVVVDDVFDAENINGPSKEKYHEAWQNTLDNLKDFRQDNSYQFAGNNPFLSQVESNSRTDQKDMYQQGIELHRDGRTSEAILAFESELQRDPEHSEAWHMLGVCHAENDEDKRAIVCYQKALDCDPYNIEALLSAGISYVNELDSIRALESLRSWVTHNPRFLDLKVSLDEYSDGTLMDEVMQLMLAVAQDSLQAGTIDPDVQIVLGVLYNVSLDYDSAIKNFRQVAALRPDDYSLLNKLGATMANSNQSDGALSMYERALSIRPRYARGWLNKGISYANLNRYDEAAKAYLYALRLNKNATHIWNYLRVVFTCMDRLDLVELAGKGDMDSIAASLGISFSEI